MKYNQDWSMDNPYSSRLFKQAIQSIVREELNNLGYDKKIPGIVVTTPASGLCDIAINSSSLSSTPSVISNVRVRNEANISAGDTVYITAINGNMNNTFLDFAKNYKAPATSWQDYVPVLTWTGTPPGSITTVARYTLLDTYTVLFNVYITSPDGNGATDLTISLPVTPKDNNSYMPVSAHQLVDTTWAKRIAYIEDDSGDDVKFRDFAACTNAKTCTILVQGLYEID
jgi:hypothetical protein